MQFVRVPEVGVPNKGVTNVGEVFTTNVDPVPVCEAIDVALPTEVIGPVRLAFVTTVAAFPTLVTPPVRLAFVITVAAFPTEVTSPVRFAFVVTFPAIKFAAVPDMLVPTSADGVPASPPEYSRVELASGSVNTLSAVVGPANAVNPFPVPPYVEAITCVSAAEPSKLFPYIALVVSNIVAVAELPVQEPDEPEAFPVTSPVKLPVRYFEAVSVVPL